MGRGRNKKGEPINGVLLLDKQQGISSNKALQQCRYLINAQKGGHTGALDPLATGLLPLCFGQATKISSFLLDSDKTYEVIATLGKTTDTGDADGKVIESVAVQVTEQDVKKVIEQFVGEYDQVPPMYSALKVNGQPLYKLARQGIEIERKARRVSAYDIRYGGLDGVELAFEVDCSSGFYVRSLVEDIGRTLACGAHVKTLRRSRIGKLSVSDAVTFDELERCEGNDTRIRKLIPADLLLDKFPGITLDNEQQVDIQFGRLVLLDNKTQIAAPWVRIYGPDKVFIGLGKVNAQCQLSPKRLFV